MNNTKKIDTFKGQEIKNSVKVNGGGNVGYYTDENGNVYTYKIR